MLRGQEETKRACLRSISYTINRKACTNDKRKPKCRMKRFFWVMVLRINLHCALGHDLKRMG